MLYQLPNGRVIEMSVEQYLELDEQDLQELMGLSAHYSLDIGNPFYRSFSKGNTFTDPELDHEIEPDLTNIDTEEKRDDVDFHRDDI